jgi:signal transduction histidine kinase
VESDLGPKLEIKGDELLLRQALLNLFDNAIKYNFRDGTVRVNLRKSPAGAVIEVANTGPGISPEHIPRVFERFYRPDPSRSSETGGTGLGLSICREIIAAHGGQVKVEIPQTGWTSFLVELPIDAS